MVNLVAEMALAEMDCDRVGVAEMVCGQDGLEKLECKSQSKNLGDEVSVPFFT